MLDRKWIIVKDAVFAALGIWIMTRGSVWAIIIGILALGWYGRDLHIQLSAIRAEKKASEVKTEKPKQPVDGGKITVSSDAKEVDYTKE